MVCVYSVDLLCLYLFLRVYQSLKSRMWNDSNSTFLRIYLVKTKRKNYITFLFTKKQKDYEKT